MIIELSGVQLGLKSYAWFQNHFEIHFEIAQFLEKNNNNKVLAIAVAKFSTQWLFAFHFPEILLITLTNLGIWLVVLFYCPILIGWEKDTILSKKWCDSWINRTTESQSDCKDNQWFQNGFNKCQLYLTTHAPGIILNESSWDRLRTKHFLSRWYDVNWRGDIEFCSEFCSEVSPMRKMVSRKTFWRFLHANVSIFILLSGSCNFTFLKLLTRAN